MAFVVSISGCALKPKEWRIGARCLSMRYFIGLAQRLTEEASRGHLSIEVFENRVRVRGTYTQLIPRMQASRHSVALTDGP